MDTINLKEIIERQELDVKEVAKNLFPGNDYPKLALDRILKNKAVLDANQISRLSAITGIPIGALYAGGQWKASYKKNLHTFRLGDFTAILDTDNWKTQMFHDDTLFHEEIYHSGGVPMSEYFKILNNQISKFRNHD